MFRRDPVKQRLAQAGEVLGRDLRPLTPLARAVFRQGGVLGVAKGDHRLILPLGGVPENGIFELASVSKPFTAALAGAVIRMGKLNWDTSLARLGGPLRGLPTHLTPTRLATHTAGLPLHPARVALTTFTRFHDPYGSMSARDVLGSARRWTRPATPPRFGYSNLGPGVLALALAYASGENLDAQGFERALHRLVTDPLGLDIRLTPESPLLVTPAGLLGSSKPTGFGPLAGAGGLHGNARDLLSFAQAHLHGQLGPHWTETLRPAGLPPHLNGIAPGWFQSAQTTWHDGVARGTRAALGFNAHTGSSAVILARGGAPLLGARGAVPLLLLELLKV